MINKQIFLSSYDYSNFSILRNITNYQWTTLDERNCLIVTVDLPLLGREYNLPDVPITTHYLTNRHLDDRGIFRDLSSFPINVYVLIPKSLDDKIISLNQLQNISWATLSDNLKDAEDHRIM